MVGVFISMVGVSCRGRAMADSAYVVSGMLSLGRHPLGLDMLCSAVPCRPCVGTGE